MATGSVTQTQSKLNSTIAPTGQTKQVPWTQHTLRQLKLVIPGAALTYYLGTLNDFWLVLQGTGGQWGQLAGYGSFALGALTVSLFLYVLYMPWISGEEPNYQSWRESGVLSSVIPVLTGSIVFGWLLSVSTLSLWSPVGYVKGTVGVSAFYILTFGLLGLVPTPKVSQKQRRS
ncbi:hypothetical protein D9619_004232 [Psilocybe cf. subviscida]|uniref:Uncharacterized protein n=1 Tax=Psilocybe cf. subviscida TaxID=2480587 RepID=A0A8H5BPK5_9AGAR|nr:hypothetical protein D9619_004232 [Psilocybe cf. subviscida]